MATALLLTSAMFLTGLGLLVAAVALQSSPSYIRIVLAVMGVLLTLFVVIVFGFSFWAASDPVATARRL